MGIKAIKLDIRIHCDSCDKEEEIQAWIPWWDAHIMLSGESSRSQRIDESQLPDLWEYYTSGGWGKTDYTKTQLLCPECVRKWREETVLDQMARKAAEKEKDREL